MKHSLIFAVYTMLKLSNLLVDARKLEDCSDPLVCLLNNIVIELPQICLDLGGKQLCIDKFMCNDLTVERIPSDYVAPTTLEVGMAGIGLSCSGDYSYGKLLKGTAEATVSNTDFLIDVFVEKENELPVSSSFSYCNVSSITVDVDFSGKVLDGFSEAVELLIAEAVDVVLCRGLANFFAVNVTDFLTSTADPAMTSIIASQPDPPPTYQPHYVTWSDSLVQTLHQLLDLVDLGSFEDFLQCWLDSATSKPSLVLDTPLSFTTPLVVPGLGSAPRNVTFQILNVTLEGLDGIQDLEVLEPVATSNVTLRTQFLLEYFYLGLGLRWSIDSGDGSTDVYSESLFLSLELKDLDFLLELDVIVDKHLLQSYYLDQLSIGGCWLSVLQQISISSFVLQTNVTELSLAQVSGSAGALEGDVVQLIDNLFLLLLSPQGFGVLISDLLAGLAQGPIRNGFNSFAADQLQQAHHDSPCLTHYPYDDDEADFIAWADSDLIKSLDLILNDVLGTQGLNRLFSCATGGTGRLSLNTTFAQIQIGGLDSFYELQLFTPASDSNGSHPYNLDNLLALGYCESDVLGEGGGGTECNPFELIINSYSYQPQEEPTPSQSRRALRNGQHPRKKPQKKTVAGRLYESLAHYQLILGVHNFSLFLDTLLVTNKNILRDLQVKQLSDPGCTASSAQALVFETLQLNLTEAYLTIQTDVGGNSTTQNITSGISSFLSFLTRDAKMNETNQQIEASLSTAADQCASSDVTVNDVDDVPGEDDSPSPTDWEWELFIVVAGGFCSLFTLLWAYNYWGKPKKLTLTNSGVVTDGSSNMLLNLHGDSCWDRWELHQCLVFHRKTPLWIRICFPLAVLGNIALFISSNQAPDAVSVMLKVYLGDRVFDVGSIFDFGLGGTVSDMWTAEVYSLAILIAFFSGAWPYIKLAFMLFAWFVPPSIMCVETRGKYLVILDALGKWSLVDFFVMILFLAAFFIEMKIGGGDQIIVDVTVFPKWGFHSFLLATMLSLSLGHIVLAVHRLTTARKQLPLPPELTASQSLFSINYRLTLCANDFYGAEDEQPPSSPVDEVVPPEQVEAGAESQPVGDQTMDRKSPLEGTALSSSEDTEDFGVGLDEKQNSEQRLSQDTLTAVRFPEEEFLDTRVMLVRFTYFGMGLVLTAILLTLLILIAGTTLTTMAFEFKGLTGLILGDEAKVDYSFTTVGTTVPEHSGHPNDFQTRWLQASYFAFGQGFPFALLVTATTLWVLPLPLGRQRQVFVLLEVINAWSTLDVFCVAIAAAILQIQQFASFIVGDSCDGINVWLAEHLDQKLDGDDKCFDVVATLEKWCWVMFLAAGLVFLVGVVTLSICNAALKQRQEESEVLVRQLVRDKRVTILYSDEGERKVILGVDKGDGEPPSLSEPLVLEFEEEHKAASVQDAASKEYADPSTQEQSALEDSEHKEASPDTRSVNFAPDTSRPSELEATSAEGQTRSSQGSSEGPQEEKSSVLRRAFLMSLRGLAYARVVEISYETLKLPVCKSQVAV